MLLTYFPSLNSPRQSDHQRLLYTVDFPHPRKEKKNNPRYFDLSLFTITPASLANDCSLVLGVFPLRGHLAVLKMAALFVYLWLPTLPWTDKEGRLEHITRHNSPHLWRPCKEASHLRGL